MTDDLHSATSCGFVTVVNANWDFHARKGIPNIPEGMGVFGRRSTTPSARSWIAGGGLRHGRVGGESDRRGVSPASEAVTIADLHATILHTLFDVGKMRLNASVPARVLDRVTKGRPIAELFS